MTRSERLYNVLKLVKENEEKRLLSIWQELYEVNNIFDVYDRLIYMKKEVNSFEEEIEELKLNTNPQFQNIIKTLNFIIEYPSLVTSLKNQQLLIDETINITFASFEMYKSFYEAQHISLEIEDDIPDDEFSTFKEHIKSIIEEIENADILDNDKNIFLSIFLDINKAISLYKVNGLNIFMEVIRNNICKIKMIDESDDENQKLVKFKNVTKIVIGKMYIWSKTYIKKKVENSIQGKAFALLDSQFVKWSELPTPDKDNNDNVEDADIIDE